VEPVTHFLTGAAISRAGLNRKTALATLALVLAAEAPDIDVLAYFGGPVFGFAHHRGITHTFVGAPFVAGLVIVAVYLVHRLRQRRPARILADDHIPVEKGPAGAPRWKLLYAYALLGVLSHILLDFTNAYGVRPFEPFSYKWYSWDIVSIVEPALYLALVAGLVLPALFALVNEEIGSRRRAPRGRAGALAALVGIVLVWGVRDYEHRRAIATMESLVYHGAEPLRLGAYPYMLNPFRWHGVVETRNFFERVEVDSATPEVDPQGRALIRYKPEETPAALAAKKSYLGRVYLDWAAFPMTEVEEHTDPQGGYTVQFFDWRYAYPERRQPPLRASVVLDQKLEVVAERFGLGVQGKREMGGASGSK
jgi:inner membrane protein